MIGEIEVWKDIPNYEGLYQVSNLGRIRTPEGKTTYTKFHGKRKWKSRIIKLKTSSYKTGNRVSLWKDGTHKDFLVARLVAMTFLRLPNNGETVNHKDGNRFNNNIDNLEWVSLTNNIRHGFKTGLYSSCKKIVLENKNSSIEFSSRSEACRYLGRNVAYIYDRIRIGKTDVTNSNGVRYKIICID